jgi:zinc finger protein
MEIFDLDCPVCGSSPVKSIQKIMRIPHFGEVMVSTLMCTDCGYRNIDVMPTSPKPPKRYILEVSDMNDLNTRIIRSGSSTLSIPELGVRIDPGMSCEGYITNIEGLLDRILNIVKQLRRDLVRQINDPGEGGLDLKPRVDRADELIVKIEKIIDEGGEFTVILEDPFGNSAIVSEKEGALRIENLMPQEGYS